MSTKIYDNIVRLYGAKALRKSAMNIRKGAGVIEWAMKGKGFRRAVEIGTYRGCATAEIAQYCDQVVTMDLVDGKLELIDNDYKWDRYAFWRSLNVNNVVFCSILNNEEKRVLLEETEFDFAFIDGDHTRAGIELDFELVKKCGHVLFHDADDNGPNKPNDVFEFISTLPKDQVVFKDIFALWTAPV